MTSKITDIELEKRLRDRFKLTSKELRMNIKPLFMLMFDHDISSISIDRNGTKCVVTIDGVQV